MNGIQEVGGSIPPGSTTYKKAARPGGFLHFGAVCDAYSNRMFCVCGLYVRAESQFRTLLTARPSRDGAAAGDADGFAGHVERLGRGKEHECGGNFGGLAGAAEGRLFPEVFDLFICLSA